LIIAFKDITLRDLCEDSDKCILIYGKEVTTQLQNRLLDLFAAESILDVVVGNLKEKRFNDSVYFELDLNESYILELIPNHTGFNLEDVVEMQTVKRIKITAIKKKI
jgi:hypothetical protein